MEQGIGLDLRDSLGDSFGPPRSREQEDAMYDITPSKLDRTYENNGNISFDDEDKGIS